MDFRRKSYFFQSISSTLDTRLTAGFSILIPESNFIFGRIIYLGLNKNIPSIIFLKYRAHTFQSNTWQTIRLLQKKNIFYFFFFYFHKDEKPTHIQTHTQRTIRLIKLKLVNSCSFNIQGFHLKRGFIDFIYIMKAKLCDTLPHLFQFIRKISSIKTYCSLSNNCYIIYFYFPHNNIDAYERALTTSELSLTSQQTHHSILREKQML